ncbi:TonB-dependent receptor [uncultured Phenylobacterium sp.]|uniref:TonB-dependent receptor n=1 Tax=uncultured Phenylobacterium sp. TaxID=349273 RepID=UPI0025DC4C82|nr:TonB-dependent receptor [uncultured Phenylobacterium sp.]
MSVTEVVVTASKRAENLQDVASAVTAFTSEMRDTTGIITAQQQLNFTPGVTYNPGADRVTIRGIGRLTGLLGTDQGVAVYDDGFYVSSVAGIGASTIRQERVEVLRGPQGTLYGRNAVGGAVNTISKRPSTTFGGEGRGSINSYGGMTGEARVTGPITDTLSGALTASYFNQNEGYYKNTAGGPDEGGVAETWSIDAQLAFKPNERFDAWIRYTHVDSNSAARNSTGITDYGVQVRGEGIPYVFYGQPAGSAPGVRDHRKFRTDQPTKYSLNDSHQVIAEVVYHADNFDVKYLGGYRSFNSLYTFDGNAIDNQDFSFPYDCATLIGIPVLRNSNLDVVEDCDIATPGTQRQFTTIHNDTLDDQFDEVTDYSHELNFSSTGDGPLQYIVGLYYYQGKANSNFHIVSANEPGNNIITIPGTSAPNIDAQHSLIYGYETSLKTKSKAIYGQIDYQFSPQLKGTLGLRGSEDKKIGHEENVYNYWLVTGFPAGAFGPGSPFTPFPIVGGYCIPGPQVAGVPPFYPIDPQFTCPIGRDLNRTHKAFTGTLGLEWTPNDDRLVYGKYSRGYKSGGYNLGYALADPFVGSEYVDAFEAGWKENLGTLQFNTAAFYYRYKGQQIQDSQIQGTILLPKLINLPRTENYGVELEVTWRPIERMVILANYGYLHATVKKGCCYNDSADPAALQPGAKPVGPATPGAVENLQPQTLVGNQPPGSPKHKAAINGSYTWDFGGGDLTASATFNYTGKSYQTLFNTPQNRIKGGTSTDLRLSWIHPDSGVTVIGSVTNVFDEEVVNGFVTLPPQNLSFQSIYLEPPRIWSLEVRYAF